MTTSVAVGTVADEAPPLWRDRMLRLAVGAFATLRVAFLVALALALVAAVTGAVLLATLESCAGLTPVYDACNAEQRPTFVAGVSLLAGGLALAVGLAGLVVGMSAPRWHGKRWGRRHQRQLDDARGWHADGRLRREAFAGYEEAFKAFRDGRTGGQLALALGLGALVLGVLLGMAAAGTLTVLHDRRDGVGVALRGVAVGLAAPAVVALGVGIVAIVAGRGARRQHLDALDATLLDLASEAGGATARRDRPV